ncbi:MAG: hypothetical protein KIT86_14030 [Hydrogenophaga sp.]|uniref:hypothetical protein n=1 Tax=Hydrogenophaga sp. TaxID=1904254 RepID=UPI0026072BF5|nr:hypothetical protein [Hydrogenophaga sp.]MCW5670773.1 hypothetical protein [Hydrogenophaga sp.]
MATYILPKQAEAFRKAMFSLVNRPNLPSGPLHEDLTIRLTTRIGTNPMNAEYRLVVY